MSSTAEILRELTEAAEAVTEAGFVCSPDLWLRLNRAVQAARRELEREP